MRTNPHFQNLVSQSCINWAGLALVSTILTKDEHSFVYAGSRNLSELALKGLQVTFPGRVIITRCVSADEDGNRAMAKEIEEKHGRIDVVIANAGTVLMLILISQVLLHL